MKRRIFGSILAAVVLFAGGIAAAQAGADSEPIFSLDLSRFDGASADRAKGLFDATGNGGGITAKTTMSGELVLENGTVTPYLIFEGNGNQNAKSVQIKPENLADNPQELTVEFWAKLDIEKCGNYAKLYMAVDAAKTNVVPMFLQRFQRDTGENRNAVAFAANGSNRTAWTRVDDYAGRWAHYVVTHTWSSDNTMVTANLYCDGSLLATAGPYTDQTRLTTAGGLLFSIGAVDLPGEQSAFMQVGAFNIYDRALGAADIARLYTQSKDRFVNPPIIIRSHRDGDKITYPVRFSGRAELKNAQKLMVSEDKEIWTELPVNNGEWYYDIVNGPLGERELFFRIEDAGGIQAYETSRRFQSEAPAEISVLNISAAGGRTVANVRVKNLHGTGEAADTDFFVISAAYAVNRMLAYATQTVTGLQNGESTDLQLAFDLDQTAGDVYFKTFAVYSLNDLRLISNISLYPPESLPQEDGLEALTPASGVRLAFAPQADTGMLKFGVANAGREENMGVTIVVYDYMGNIDYIDAGRTDESGKWRGAYLINNTEIGKEFSVYCAAGSDRAQGTFRFYTQESIDEALALIKSTDYTQIYDKVFNQEPYRFIFALDFTQYNALSDRHKAYVMMDVAGREYTKVEEVQNSFIAACDIQKTLQDIEEADPKDLESGTEKLLRDSGYVTDFASYYGKLSDENKAVVLSEWIYKQVFQSGAAVNAAFTEGERVVYVNSLQKAALVQKRVFQDSYGDFGLSAGEVSYYNGLSDNNKVKMMEYFKADKIERLEEIRLAFLAAEKRLKDDIGKNSNTQRPSSGGGGGSRPGVSVVPPAEHSNQPVAEEDKIEETKPNQFLDLDRTHWAYAYIGRLMEAGIVSGTSATTFEPDRPVNREEFLKMLLEALQIEIQEDGVADFSDIQPGAWYAKYVAAGTAVQIVSGYEDGTFGVGRTLSRSEMCVLIVRALEAADKRLSFVAEPVQFADHNEIPAFAQAAISDLQKAEIISGMDGSFQPEGNATRAMAARVICAMLDNIQ